MASPSFLLVYPRLQFRRFDTVKPDGSLSLPYLAGQLRRAGFDVSILDATVGTERDDLGETFYTPSEQPNGLIRIGMSDERFLEECTPHDVIGITSIFTMQTNPTLDMVRLIRRTFPDKWIIGGGVGARNLVDRFLDAGMDAIFLSEADEQIVEFARRLSRPGSRGHRLDMEGIASRRVPGEKTLYRVAHRIPGSLDALAMPAWDLLPNNRYWKISRPHGGNFPAGMELTYASMMTSRGCPFACAYCHISKEVDGEPAGPVGALRLKSIGRVIAEASALRALGARYVFIEDDSLLAKKNRASDIFREMTALGLRLVDVNGINIVHLMKRTAGQRLMVDGDLLDLMAGCGFTQLALPFESGSQRILDRWASRKWRLDQVDSDDLIRQCLDRGITPLGSYTIGYPDESLDEIMTTIELAQRHVETGLSLASFFIIVPFPGSRLFDYAVEHGHLSADFDPDDMNWTRSIFTNTPVSADTLEAIRRLSWHLVNRPEAIRCKESRSSAVLTQRL